MDVKKEGTCADCPVGEVAASSQYGHFEVGGVRVEDPVPPEAEFIVDREVPTQVICRRYPTSITKSADDWCGEHPKRRALLAVPIVIRT